MSDKNKVNLSNKIMAKINHGQIKMKSQLNILAENIGLGSGVFLSFLILIFMLSGLIYWIRINQDLFNIPGPYRGIKLIIQTFPYLLLIGFISLFVLLNSLLKKYDFSYKQPIIVIFSLIIALITMVGILLQKHPALANFFKYQIQSTYLPKNSELGYVIGNVINKSQNQLFIKTDNQQHYVIVYDQTTRMPQQSINIGDIIRAVGTFSQEKIRAIVVMNLSKQKQWQETAPSRQYRIRQNTNPGRRFLKP